MMLLFATLTTWGAELIYFWISLLALCISPFFFNPHQFSWDDFFIDYRDYLRWLSRGNSRSHASSWIAHCRVARTRITGYKRKVLGEPSAKAMADAPRAHIRNLVFSEVLGPLILIGITLIPYLYINSQTGVTLNNPANRGMAEPVPANAILRVAIVAFAPIAVNAGVAIMFFAMACCMGPILGACCKKTGAVLAGIAHAISVIILLVLFEVLFALEAWSFAKTLLGMVCALAIQRFIYKLIIALALTRELKTDTANIAWWTGKWYGMGWHSMSQPGREFLCKITELGFFSGDFILGHILLFLMLPLLVIPYFDTLHSMMLFWLRPSKQIRPPMQVHRFL
jgi:1,3-beta-glucan synthase